MTLLHTQSARSAKKAALWTPWGNIPHRPSASPRQPTEIRAGKSQKTPTPANAVSSAHRMG